MHLKLLPMEESDLSAYQNVAWAAFKDDLMALLYPNGYTEAAREHSRRTTLDDWRKHPDKIKMMKTVDTDLPEDDPNGKIVAVGVWNFYPRDRTEDELQAEAKENEEHGFPPDGNSALMGEFHGNIEKYKKEIIGGKAYIYLQILATLPEYHRRGIGAMHLRWGLEEADRLGVPAYLESSPMGKALYERMGYQVVREFEFDAKKWGGDKDLPHLCMLRPARTATAQP